MKEAVLYYNPGNAPKPGMMKSVLVRMGVRIKNVTEEQLGETIGTLLGIPEIKSEKEREDGSKHERKGPLEEQILVLYRFSENRLDQLLYGLRKAGVPKIELKAVVTEQNSQWTMYELYEELKKEREALTGAND